jgi:hypothetical protein
MQLQIDQLHFDQFLLIYVCQKYATTHAYIIHIYIFLNYHLSLKKRIEII